MAQWANIYREEAIPGANPAGTITEHRPGQKLAKAVTELQERVVVDVATELQGIQDNGTSIENNTLTIRLGLAEGALPLGGQKYQVLQRDAAGNAVWDWVRAVEVT